MTEAEWWKCGDTKPMLRWLRGKASARKLRLFAVACCREYPDVFDEPRLEAAVAVAERFADGLSSETDRAAAEAGVLALLDEWDNGGDYESCSWVPAVDGVLWVVGYPFTSDTAQSCAAYVAGAAGLEHTWGSERFGIGAAVRADQAELLRDIIPYRPPAFDPRWATGTVRALVGGIYFRHAFDRMPVLADALEDAGCDHPDVLAHCRGPGPHARGCWVVDLCLGKA